MAAEILDRRELLDGLPACPGHPNRLVRMRAAYALSKVADKRPDLLRPHKTYIIDCLAEPANGALCRACLLQLLPTLDLHSDDVDLLAGMLLNFMHSESSIVRIFSLQLPADFAEADPALRPEIMPLLWDAREIGTPAMRARARKLMKKYRLERTTYANHPG